MFQFPGFAFIPLWIQGINTFFWISAGPKITLRGLERHRPGIKPVQPDVPAKKRASSEQQRSKVGFPIRRFTDQSLFAAPHDLSQRTTSFIASQRQGIHQTPFRHLIALIAKARCSTPIEEIGTSNALARKDQFCFKRIRGFERSSSSKSTTGCSKVRPAKGSTSAGPFEPRRLASLKSGLRPNALPLHNVRQSGRDRTGIDPRKPVAPSSPGAAFGGVGETDLHRTFLKDEQRLDRRAFALLLVPSGGARRDRTDDLMLAKHALSQLSYGPGWWAWEDLNLRPHAYQARALTN